ncbi:hypothetical protein CYMTET_22800 [Cymbomonas tetramitiformis]|uniref:Uncharacterized protein n=1 Tax=Cymbomonas tetramitiformis TaxID=36881 RepID=A0AAE0G015_9CHLO|nr:hypothetical protein CYMTET_54696 [Cymbomonas tetramitiformis]KAK3268710.1 hypothetical protein CYMTET_22800 [Cymbomonas tetramitiformis]
MQPAQKAIPTKLAKNNVTSSLSTKSEPASQSSHSQLSLGRIFKVTFRYISTVDELPPRLLDLRYSCK